MTNTFLIFTDVYLQEITLDASSIESYWQVGPFSEIKTKSGREIQVKASVDQISQALVESLFMIKRVAHEVR